MTIIIMKSICKAHPTKQRHADPTSRFQRQTCVTTDTLRGLSLSVLTLNVLAGGFNVFWRDKVSMYLVLHLQTFPDIPVIVIFLDLEKVPCVLRQLLVIVTSKYFPFQLLATMPF